MVQIIAGKKGKGKTKHLLDRANSAIRDSKGSIVYLDKSSKHMYELSNKIRLCGIISQDHDLEMMFLDSFLKLSCLEGEDITDTITTLERIGEKYHVTFVLSVSMDAENLPENAQADVVVSL